MTKTLIQAVVLACAVTSPTLVSVTCAEDASNITIEGLGVIDGRGTPEVFPRHSGSGSGKSRRRLPRPRLLRMDNCSKLVFSGVTYKRPAF